MTGCRTEVQRESLQRPDLAPLFTSRQIFGENIDTNSHVRLQNCHKNEAKTSQHGFHDFYDFTFLVWLHFSQHHGFHWRWGNTLVVLLCIDSYTTTKASLRSYVALVRAEDEVEILLVLALGLVLTHIFYKQPSHCFLLMVSMYSQKC